MRKNIFIEIISFLLITLFVYAALSKLFNYTDFKDQLSSEPLTKKYPALVTVILPAAELITAGMLTFTPTRRAGLAASFIILILFTVYIIYMLLFEKDLPCSCGGILRQMTWKQHLLFNIFFLILAFAGIKILQDDAQHSA